MLPGMEWLSSIDMVDQSWTQQETETRSEWRKFWGRLVTYCPPYIDLISSYSLKQISHFRYKHKLFEPQYYMARLYHQNFRTFNAKPWEKLYDTQLNWNFTESISFQMKYILLKQVVSLMAVRFFWQPARCLLHLENKNTTTTIYFKNKYSISTWYYISIIYFERL